MTVEEILAKLKALEALGSCAACGNDAWETQAKLVSWPTVVDGRINPLEGLECVVRLCTHCGNARFHATEFVQKR